MAKTNVNAVDNSAGIHLVFLNADQIAHIDRALGDVGDFGEVRLVKVKGKLRFIQKMSSEEVSPVARQ